MPSIQDSSGLSSATTSPSRGAAGTTSSGASLVSLTKNDSRLLQPPATYGSAARARHQPMAFSATLAVGVQKVEPEASSTMPASVASRVVMDASSYSSTS